MGRSRRQRFWDERQEFWDEPLETWDGGDSATSHIAKFIYHLSSTSWSAFTGDPEVAFDADGNRLSVDARLQGVAARWLPPLWHLNPQMLLLLQTWVAAPSKRRQHLAEMAGDC